MPAHRWTLSDGVETYALHINPHGGGTPEERKQYTIRRVTDPTARPIIWQGPDDVKRTSVTGVILTGDHLRSLQDWVRKNTEVTLTDDVGRVMLILLESFSPTRKRSRRRWRHEYTLTYLVLEELDRGNPDPETFP